MDVQPNKSMCQIITIVDAYYTIAMHGYVASHSTNLHMATD